MLPLRPDRHTALAALARQTAVPLLQPIDASTLASPRAVFAQCATGPHRWLLDSARKHPVAGRYSYVAWAPRTVLEAPALDELRTALQRAPILPVLGAPPFIGGAIGYFGYEYRHRFETLPQRAPRDLPLPEALVAFYDTLVAWDHVTHQCYVISIAWPGAEPERAYTAAVGRVHAVAQQISRVVEPPVTDGAATQEVAPALAANCTREQFTAMVERALQHIAAGDIYQANLSVRFEAPLQDAPWRIYERLQHINPSPYAAFADLGAWAIASSSPELLLCVHGREVTTRPIAGTRPRGATPAEDLAQSVELILSDKERAEHLMLVDLERNDLGRVCRYGSVLVDELMALEDYSHVIHIVSNVRGQLRAGCDWADALTALFPGGTITGCPKVRAMEIIDALEPTARGLYTGSIGWISYTGEAAFNIAIRTIVCAGGRAYVQAGAGIVADSQPDREYAEIQAKAQALFEALRVGLAAGRQPVAA